MTRVWTIGHSTRTAEAFAGLLRGEGIELVADVRSYPGSRTNPQFGRATMRGWLDDTGIGYRHLAALGGRRNKQDADPEINAGWHNAAFRNYADYTRTPAYEDGIAELLDLAGGRRVACMCSEALPWRCHRLLIANTLTARGVKVRHIMGDHEVETHELGRWGAPPRVHDDGTVTYPADA